MMIWMRDTLLALAASLALMSTGASAQRANWNNEVRVDGQHHVIGDPEAEHTLIEFVSYTCPHCATFTKQGEGTLQLAFIGPGHMLREVRNIVRDPIDLTVTMLTHCGRTDRFSRRHEVFMREQEQWLPVARRATAAQRARWETGDYAARRRAIAADLDFYTIMERLGMRRAETDRCLSDDAKAQALVAASVAHTQEFELQGTPSFAIDGKLLADTHDWATLEPQLVVLYK